MQKIFLVLLIMIGLPLFADPDAEVQDSDDKSSEFWPPDFIPHPHPPGSGPSGPGEPEMA